MKRQAISVTTATIQLSLLYTHAFTGLHSDVLPEPLVLYLIVLVSKVYFYLHFLIQGSGFGLLGVTHMVGTCRHTFFTATPVVGDRFDILFSCERADIDPCEQVALLVKKILRFIA